MLEQQICEYTGETGARDIGEKKDAEIILPETIVLFLIMYFNLSPCYRMNQIFVLSLCSSRKLLSKVHQSVSS